MFYDYYTMVINALRIAPKELLFLIPVAIFMIMASVNDAKEMKIPNKLNYTMIILRLMFAGMLPITGEHILGFILGGALIMIPAMILLKPMGGDIKFSAALGFWVGDVSILLTLIFAVIMFLFYGIKIKKLDMKKSLAFAPFMSIAYVLVAIIGVAIYFYI